MPLFRPKAKRLRTKASNFLHFLSLVACYLSVVTFLSACTAIGTNKPAALQVTSTPEASVFLDGKHLGKTPFFSDQLKAGEYTLKISATGASYTEKISLNSSTLTVVKRELADNFLAQSGETLWLENGKNELFVLSMPADAEITIDGTTRGKTPLQLDDLAEGEHKITLAKDGYSERVFTIKTSTKYKLLADVTLASQVAKEPAEKATPAKIEQAEVLKTPQGFLRVRNEPLATATEIGRVQTGDKLDIIQETEDWIKVSFEGKQGWISSQYVKKI